MRKPHVTDSASQYATRLKRSIREVKVSKLCDWYPRAECSALGEAQDNGREHKRIDHTCAKATSKLHSRLISHPDRVREPVGKVLSLPSSTSSYRSKEQ